MKKNIPADADLLKSIRAGGAEREDALRDIMEYNVNYVARFSGPNGMEVEDARNAYALALVALQNAVLQNGLEAGTKLRSELWTLMKQKSADLVLRRMSHDGDQQRLLQGETKEQKFNAAVFLDIREDHEESLKYIHGLGPVCYGLLVDVERGYSLDELVKTHGLDDLEHAKKRRASCKAMLKRIIAKHNKSEN